MTFDCDLWATLTDTGVHVHVELARLLSGIGNNGLRYFYLEIERLLVEINMYKTLESRRKITGKSYRIRQALKRKKNNACDRM